MQRPAPRRDRREINKDLAAMIAAIEDYDLPDARGLYSLSITTAQRQAVAALCNLRTEITKCRL